VQSYVSASNALLLRSKTALSWSQVREQRVTLKLCFKPGKTATETVEKVRAANGDETLTGSNIFRW